MINIKYVSDEIYGEPGPTVYFSGQPNDYIHLASDIHFLGVENGKTIVLNCLDYVECGQKITMNSTVNGQILCEIDGQNINISLDSKLWPHFVDKLISISYNKSHNYIDYDELDLHEDANIIISSENSL